MTENTSNIPLDDEDILDLTVVAEPGKSAARGDGPPEMSDPTDPADFGADLDALLDSLGADGTVSAPAAKAVTAKPVAAPIADQTPVDHKVDPDEEMAMPEMSDIDSLLAGLGAENPTGTAPMPEFDGILAQAQAAEAKKAEEEAEVAAIAAAPAVPPQPAQAQPQTDRPQPVQTQPQPAPAMPEDIPDEPLPDDEDAAGDALDLNELDALLDDILATAPEMGVTGKAAAPAPAPAKAAPPQAAPVPAAQTDVDIPLPVTPPATVEKEVPAASPPPQAETSADVIPVPDQAIMPAAGDIAALAERVQRLEESVTALEADIVPETMVQGLIDATLESLFVPDSPLMERLCKELQKRFAAGDFSESLEKMAAAAAAKVIREEIAALMQE